VESAQAAGRGVKRMRNPGEVAAPGKSVVRDFLQSPREALASLSIFYRYPGGRIFDRSL
jgi:hypothetical protein